VEEGLRSTGRPYLKITDRREAIFRAVAEARAGDIVVIAGKGHEDYQIIGTERRHFDDREVAREALAERSRQ
jgi:UDP-N-acetylmuramoyl-L-alanyl-D-glutamate--2,6-diaminopimelate ligase